VTAWLLVVLLLLGLPLLGWWLGSRRAWTRLEGAHDGAVRQEWDWIKRHRLNAAEQAQIDRAIRRGERLDDPRLRLAVVDRVHATRSARQAWEDRHPRWTEAVRWLKGLWLLGLVAAVAFGIVSGYWPPTLPLYLASAAVAVVGEFLQQRNLARALERNADAEPERG